MVPEIESPFGNSILGSFFPIRRPPLPRLMLYTFSCNQGSTVRVHALFAIALHFTNERTLRSYFLKPHHGSSLDHASYVTFAGQIELLGGISYIYWFQRLLKIGVRPLRPK